MRAPGKSALAALLLIFSPGIAFALFEIFFVRVPVQGRTLVVGWVSLAVGAVCVVGLLWLAARDAVLKRRDRRSGQ
jgi:hypothetical protein